MRKWLILLSTLLGTCANAGPAWTWVDANGTVHFSDTPVPGAKQIAITGAQGFGTAPRSQPQPSTRAAAAPPPNAQQPSTSYRTLSIVSPGQQETLWNIGTNLNVQLAIEPGLAPNHRLDLLIDGQRRNLGATSTQLVVPDVFRGTHTMQALIVDQRGSEISRSPSTTFTVQQTSIQNPNAPLARPPQARPPQPTPKNNGGN